MSTEESTSSLSVTLDELSRERFIDFLVEQAAKGISQQEVARLIGVAPQFVSDLKAGRRGMSELFARRLEDKFERPRGWFLGRDADAAEMLPAKRHTARTYLPVFPNPIKGDPYTHPDWNGMEIEICGVAALRGLAGRWSYLLQFGIDDRRGRLRRNDLILISQDVAQIATIHVLESRNQRFLARRKEPDGWEALLMQRKVVGEATIIGHCVGVVWAAL